MRRLIQLTVLILLLPAMALATTYSCRDREGQLYMTDNPQALPKECRERTQVREKEDSGTLNFVPEQQAPAGAGREFERQVREVEEGLQQRQQRSDNYRQQAQQLVADYQQAVREKRQALRSWSYESREIIQAADERVRKARAGKKKLLQELDNTRLLRKDEQAIREILKGVEAD